MSEERLSVYILIIDGLIMQVFDTRAAAETSGKRRTKDSGRRWKVEAWQVSE